MPDTNENLKNNDEVKEAELNSLLKDSKNLVANAKSVDGGVPVNYILNKHLEGALEGAGLSPDLLKNNTDNEYRDFVRSTDDEYHDFADKMDGEFGGEKLYNEFNFILDGEDFSGLNKFSEQQINNLLNYLSLPNNEKLFDDLYKKISQDDIMDKLYKSGNNGILEKFGKVALDKKRNSNED